MSWLVQTGLNPWNEQILTHAQWNLVYAALAFGASDGSLQGDGQCG